MKFKVISRNEAEYTGETKFDITVQTRNLAPEAHPFQNAREYTRALNATKLDKVFAKPFLHAFDGHLEEIWRLTTVPTLLTTIFSGSCDGEMRAWNVTTRELTWRVKAHKGFVRGMSPTVDGERIITCGDDKAIRIWDLNASFGRSQSMAGYEEGDVKPVTTFVHKDRLTDLSCSWEPNTGLFATSGAQVDLWSEQRSKPIHSFAWSSETVNGVKYSPVEHNLLCGWTTDRKLVIYDTRIKNPTNHVTIRNQINCVSWNPQEAFMFTLGSEDYNAYTFDCRKLKKAVKIHMGHVQGVESISYSPTGREFVTGGYDCSVRLWNVKEGTSRAFYHTKRMQRVRAVCYTSDNRFVISGSDDANVRIWKAQASQPLDKLKPPEERKLRYYAKLKKRFAHMPEIRRISKHQHMPRWIKTRRDQERVMKDRETQKEKNRRKHSKPGSRPLRKEKEKHIVRVKH